MKLQVQHVRDVECTGLFHLFGCQAKNAEDGTLNIFRLQTDALCDFTVCPVTGPCILAMLRRKVHMDEIVMDYNFTSSPARVGSVNIHIVVHRCCHIYPGWLSPSFSVLV